MSLLIQDSETAESLGISFPKIDSVSHGVERPQASQENRRRASTGSSSVSETGSTSEVDSGSRIQYGQPFNKSYGTCRYNNAFAEVSIRLEVFEYLLKMASPHPFPLSPQQKVATPIRNAYNIFFEAQNKMAIQRNTRSSRNFVFWKSQVFRLSLLPVGVSISYHKFASQHLLGICSRLAKSKSICACSTLNRFVKLAEVRVFLEDSISAPQSLCQTFNFNFN